jgi:hypothetical protein
LFPSRRLFTLHAQFLAGPLFIPSTRFRGGSPGFAGRNGISPTACDAVFVVEPESAEAHGDGKKRHDEKRPYQAGLPSKRRGKSNKKGGKAEDERDKGQRLPRKKAIVLDPCFHEEKDESRGKNEGNDPVESPTAGCRR